VCGHQTFVLLVELVHCLFHFLRGHFSLRHLMPL
jgi:hypothetical protein